MNVTQDLSKMLTNKGAFSKLRPLVYPPIQWEERGRIHHAEVIN